MFKINSFENELRDSMQKHLISNQVEEQHGVNKIAKAVDYLYSAAKIFDNAGMQEEANEIAKFLEELASEFV
jgi:hypothetical protein